jgi:7-keto-8-aminopelargonate synthetase-like enzyme
MAPFITKDQHDSYLSIILHYYFPILLAEGIYVVGFSFPVVPKGKARIRVQISAAHTTEDIDRTVKAFIKIGRTKKVIQ